MTTGLLTDEQKATICERVISYLAPIGYRLSDVRIDIGVVARDHPDNDKRRNMFVVAMRGLLAREKRWVRAQTNVVVDLFYDPPAAFVLYIAESLSDAALIQLTRETPKAAAYAAGKRKGLR